MSLFLERFVLGLCVAAVGIIVVNPLNLNSHQRSALLLIVAGVVYLTVATHTRINRKKDGGVPVGSASAPGRLVESRPAAHPGIVFEWSHSPFPTYVRLMNRSPDVLMNVDAEIVDIKRREGTCSCTRGTGFLVEVPSSCPGNCRGRRFTMSSYSSRFSEAT